MDLRSLLESYKEGRISIEDAEKELRLDYVDSIGDDVLFDRARE